MNPNNDTNSSAVEDAEPPVVVVIDMQIKFKDILDPQQIAAVSAEIRRAMAAGEAIIFVEFDGEGETQRGLLELVEGYDRAVRITRADHAGHEEIHEACIENGFWPENFRVCGVNADGSVSKTVEGLLLKKRVSSIEVVKNACHSDSKWPNWKWANWHTRVETMDERVSWVQVEVPDGQLV